MIQEIKNQIIADFSKAWEVNDKAHRVEHFSNVEECGMYLADQLGLGFNRKLITMVAFFHDMFAWSRFNHHLMSAEWVMSTDYPLITRLSEQGRKMVAAGCREHRASNTDAYSCKFAELMASADREFPGNIENMVERAVLYRMNKGMTRDEAYGPAVDHIKEKFGLLGYCRYPNMYLSVFGDALQKQRDDIKNL